MMAETAANGGNDNDGGDGGEGEGGDGGNGNDGGDGADVDFRLRLDRQREPKNDVNLFFFFFEAVSDYWHDAET